MSVFSKNRGFHRGSVFVEYREDKGEFYRICRNHEGTFYTSVNGFKSRFANIHTGIMDLMLSNNLLRYTKVITPSEFFEAFNVVSNRLKNSIYYDPFTRTIEDA